MKNTERRVDASLLTEEERGRLPALLELVERSGHSLRGANGEEIPLPEPIFGLLVKVIDDMRQGKAVILIPAEETFTTQAAANFLGMSRQHFVTLIEGGKIAFHRVGAHRRVYFKDLLKFANERDKERRARLGGLFKGLKEQGLYDANPSDSDAQ